MEVVYLRQKSYLEVLFSIPGVPIENKHVKGGGLYESDYLEVVYLQQKSYLEVLYLQQKSYLEVLYLRGGRKWAKSKF